MRFMALWMALSLLPLSCLADIKVDLTDYIAQASEPKRTEISAKLPPIVEQFGKSLGCSFSMDPRNVIPYQLEGKSVFLAVYELDVGCSGTPTATRPLMAILSQSPGGDYFVDAEYSMPKQTSAELPKHISSLFIKNDDLWYQGLTFKAADASCCPTLDVTGRIALENGVWKEHQRMPLERVPIMATP
ncbi:hypothetical protein ACFQDN_06650 [Pseudomonas asuensis]|jgi:hypothetical protein|uniref:DUF1176 domain-containing protein n=1 Tax=Pseudomonas asuensis TaxID=1825787 RepID=A0ABQ2GS38_9PSED|nr:hypothetical protein [Pseudomonas asuensis]GGM08716.1 hypothetical protein GCM10009425_19960 [Pseudomonas asuensis]